LDTTRIAYIIIYIDVFHAFDIIAGVVIFEMQNTDQNKNLVPIRGGKDAF